MARRIGDNAGALLVARLATAGATLAVSPVLFAELGARRFGIWALVVGTIGIAGLADLGIGSAQVREVARAEVDGDVGRARGALAVGLALSACTGAALVGVVLVAWQPVARLAHLAADGGDARTAALLVALGFVCDAIASPWRAALEGTQRMAPVAVAVATTTVLGAAGGAVLVHRGLGLAGLGAATVCAGACRALALVMLARRLAPGFGPSAAALRREHVRPLLAYGLRVQVTNGAAAVNNDTDRLVLGGAVSAAVVGSFDLGAKLANTLRLVAWQGLAALFPAAAALDAAHDRVELDRLYLRASRYLALFASMAALLLAFCAEPLVRLWIGQPLPFAAHTVALLAVAYAINVVGGPASALARAEGTPAREMRYAVLTAALNVALTIGLLVALGPLGVPLATTAAYALGTAYFLVHFHRSSQRPLRGLLAEIWKPFAATTLAAAAAWTCTGLLPDGTGRLAAAEAVATRATLVTLLAVAFLVALRFPDAGDRALLGRVTARLRPRAPGSLVGEG